MITTPSPAAALSQLRDALAARGRYRSNRRRSRPVFEVGFKNHVRIKGVEVAS